MPHRNPRTWVSIDSVAITKNVTTLKKQLHTKTKCLAVVKADAYGHGLLPVVRAALLGGADYLAVFSITEAVTLRQAKITKPILVLQGLQKEDISTAIMHNLDVVVSTFEVLTYLKKTRLRKPLRVHLMTDTGLGRDGFLLEDSSKVAALIVGNKNINLVGIATHFAASESRSFDTYTVMQVAFVFEWQKVFRELGFSPMLHASATAGIFIAKDFGIDMVRFGIGIYGLWPSKETQSLGRGVVLTPALEWKTVVNEVKRLQAGSYIGYDLTVRLGRDSIVAIVPVGYSDGYPRSGSNKGTVLVGGKRARILGRVMMNMMVVDVTDIPRVKVGDVVTLIGKDKKEFLSAEDVAEATGTISYELVTRIAASVPRIYKK